MKELWLAALAFGLIGMNPAWGGTSLPGQALPAGTEIVPRYLLMDDRGRAVSNEDFRGSFQLITFGYTFCPDVCPTTLSKMALILEKLGKQSARLQPLFISVDPERDTAEVLHRYTEYFSPRIIGLTGTPELVRRVADNFKVKYEKHFEQGAAPGKYSVDHSVGMYLLGPDGRFITKFAYGSQPEDVAARILGLMKEFPVKPSR